MPDKTNYTLIVHIDPKDLVTKTFPKSALGIANLFFPRDVNCVVTSKAVPSQCGHNSFATQLPFWVPHSPYIYFLIFQLGLTLLRTFYFIKKPSWIAKKFRDFSAEKCVLRNCV